MQLVSLGLLTYDFLLDTITQKAHIFSTVVITFTDTTRDRTTSPHTH